MRKQQLYILAGIGLLLVGGAVLMWQKQSKQAVIQDQSKQEDVTNVDISDWKMYRNEEYGFEVKYPTDWTVLESADDNSDRLVISLTSPETLKMIQDRKTDSSCDLSVYYYPSVAEEPENKMNYFKAVTIEEMINKNHMITRIGQTILGEEQATDVVWGGNGAYYTILSDHANHLYIISSCNKENREALTQTEMTILESFKFIK